MTLENASAAHPGGEANHNADSAGVRQPPDQHRDVAAIYAAYDRSGVTTSMAAGSNRLPHLAERIRVEHQAAAISLQRSLDHAMAAGLCDAPSVDVSLRPPNRFIGFCSAPRRCVTNADSARK